MEIPPRRVLQPLGRTTSETFQTLSSPSCCSQCAWGLRIPDLTLLGQMFCLQEGLHHPLGTTPFGLPPGGSL